MRRRKVLAAKLIADGLWVDLRRGKYDPIRQLACGNSRCRTTFRAYQPDQPLLLPPDLQEWVFPGHLAHHVSDVVDALDLTAFYAPYEGDGRRNAPYEPSMMVKVLIYAYATGTFSSRAVARKLEEDVAFRMLAAGNFPQHRTVCEFRRRHLAEFSEPVCGGGAGGARDGTGAVWQALGPEFIPSCAETLELQAEIEALLHHRPDTERSGMQDFRGELPDRNLQAAKARLEAAQRAPRGRDLGRTAARAGGHTESGPTALPCEGFSSVRADGCRWGAPDHRRGLRWGHRPATKAPAIASEGR